MSLQIGQILYGYCGGLFEDSYEHKRVEAVGVDWVVAREIDSGHPVYADNDWRDDPPISIHDTLKQYTTEEERLRWDDPANHG